MRLLYGGVQLGVTNAAKVVPARALLRNAAGVGYGFKWTVGVEAYLKLSDNNADTTAQMAAVETATRAQNQTLRFLYDDGSDTVHAWTDGGTVTGTRCTGLTWTGDPGAQFRTWRSFECAFEFETRFVSGSFLLDFKETVQIEQALPKYVVNEGVNGAAPEAQLTVARTKTFATQSGRAVGLSAYPAQSTIAPPLFGASSPPLRKARFGRDSADRVGANSERFAVSWAYEFESPDALDFLMAGASAIQFLTVTATGGTYRLRLGAGGPWTANIAWNANAAAIQAQLDITFGATNTVVTGTGPYGIAFAGGLANRPVDLIDTDPALLTGPGADATVFESQVGTRPVTAPNQWP